jgi:hypothetical protein
MDPIEPTKRPADETASNDLPIEIPDSSTDEPASKRIRIDETSQASQSTTHKAPRPRIKGVAPIKEECVVDNALPIHICS